MWVFGANKDNYATVFGPGIYTFKFYPFIYKYVYLFQKNLLN